MTPWRWLPLKVVFLWRARFTDVDFSSYGARTVICDVESYRSASREQPRGLARRRNRNLLVRRMKPFRLQSGRRNPRAGFRKTAEDAETQGQRPGRGRLIAALSIGVIGAIGAIGAGVVAFNLPSSAQPSAAEGSSAASRRATPVPPTSSPSASASASASASVSATTPAPTPTSVPAAPLRVLTIGDSIMKGLGVETNQAWPELISQQDGWSLTTLACNGAGFLAIGVADDCGSNFSSIVQTAGSLRPDLVIIEGSSNDFGMSNSSLLESTVGAVSALHAQFPQAKIVGLSAVWGDTTVPDEIAEIDSQVQQAMTQVGGTYLNVGQPLSGHPELMQSDDVHPTAAGQQVLAATIKEALLPAEQAAADTANQAAGATSPASP